MVSIPQSGQRTFKQCIAKRAIAPAPFQSLNRDKGRSNYQIRDEIAALKEFQSLNRDKGRSNPGQLTRTLRRKFRFNPSIGTKDVQTYRAQKKIAAGKSFNPSIGTKDVQTLVVKAREVVSTVSIPQSGQRTFKQMMSVIARPGNGKFQSLNRDKGRSNFNRARCRQACCCRFNPSIGTKDVQTGLRASLSLLDLPVSIPQSGQRTFKRFAGRTPGGLRQGFNPSIGTKDVQTQGAGYGK